MCPDLRHRKTALPARAESVASRAGQSFFGPRRDAGAGTNGQRTPHSSNPEKTAEFGAMQGMIRWAGQAEANVVVAVGRVVVVAIGRTQIRRVVVPTAAADPAVGA